MEFKSKLAGLKSGGGGRKPPGGRTRERQEWLRTNRFPYESARVAWHFSLKESESVLLESEPNKELFSRGGTVGDEDSTAFYTVQQLGWKLVKMGWGSIVPQERTGGRRPAPIVHPATATRRERTFGFKYSEHRERPLSLSTFLNFEHTYRANLAIQCCKASGYIRVIDADCRDPEVAEFVKQAAFKHLGITPFVRYGSRPKFMLVYRVDPSNTEDLNLKISPVVLLGADGNEDLDADNKPMNVIEYLGHGAIFTAYGLHHRTGLNFDWSEGAESPITAGPDAAPVITSVQLRAFFNAVHAFRRIKPTTSPSNPHGSKSVALEFDAVEAHRGGRLWLPRRVNGSWTMNDDGKVVDGSHEWLTAQVWAVCAANAHMLRANYHDIEEFLVFEGRLRLLGVHRENPALQTEAQIEREMKRELRVASEKWYVSLAEHARTGSYVAPCFPWTIGEDGRKPNSQRIVGAARPADGSLDWIPDESCPIEELAEHRPEAKTSIVAKTIEQVEADRAARSLVETKEERKTESQRVTSEVSGIIHDWLWTEVSPRLKPVDNNTTIGEAVSRNLMSAPWILLGPTGSGKTVGSLGNLGPFCRAHPREANQGPILLVLPTHANGDEAMATAMREGMFNADLWSEGQINSLEGELRGQGVKIERMKGRDNFCLRLEERQALTSKGIGASRLCEAEIDKDPDFVANRTRRDNRKIRAANKELPRSKRQKLGKVKTERLLCPFKGDGSCGYFAQMAKVKAADIVIVSHAYLTLHSLPQEVRNPRAIIIDESVVYALLKQAHMPLSVLRSIRKEAFVTERDRERWPTWSTEDISAHYTVQRNTLCELAQGWLEAGLDIANELAKLPNGAELLDDTIQLLVRALDRDRAVRPDLTPAGVSNIANAAVGRFLLAEKKMWELVKDRMTSVADGTAKGDHDYRLQVVMDWETDPVTKERSLTPHLRIAWRVNRNWQGVPTLLLDASAKPEITRKLFGAEPVMKPVTAKMRIRTLPMIERTWSNSTFLPPTDATAEEVKAAAEAIEQARRLITTTAMIFGHGRVLVGTTLKVREVLTAMGWTPPPNVDFVHFGALRGRDFARGHVAAISIGRSEQPISIIDGYAAALTYDDDVPEEPLDKLGTGFTAEGKILFREQRWQDIFMRTGQDIQTLIGKMPKGRPMLGEDGKQLRNDKDVPLFHKSWGELLEESWREEELSQFVGRLRPVHRGIDDDLPPPVYIAVGKILPPGVVVDEIIEMSSVLKLWPMAELARLSGGVISDNVRVPGSETIFRGRTLKEVGEDLPKGLKLKTRLFAAFAHARYQTLGELEGVYHSAMLLPGWVDGDAVGHFEALSERHGKLVDVISITPPKLVGPVAQVKPVDGRDVDRDDALIAEIEVREARYAEPQAAEHSLVEFEMRRARGLYEEQNERDDSALSDAAVEPTVDACKSTSTSAPKISTPASGHFSTRRFGQQSPPG